MDERAALRLLGDRLTAAGDDAAVVGEDVLTIDMLHETTDFPDGTTRYTAGWRAVGASLSDLAAMGARARAAVAAYAAPAFERAALAEFVDGAEAVCELVGAEYVGGDLDEHAEFTVATTALGGTDAPVYRHGAAPGEAVCVTGTLGRSAVAFRLFERGEHDRANALYRFEPRVAAGRALADPATAMLDSSDGLARSLHQLGAASDCGIAIEAASVPVDPRVEEVAAAPEERRELGWFFGEDFELVCTMPPAAVEPTRATLDAEGVALAEIGRITEADAGVTVDGAALPDRGFTHGA